MSKVEDFIKAVSERPQFRGEHEEFGNYMYAQVLDSGDVKVSYWGFTTTLPKQDIKNFAKWLSETFE